MGFFDDLADGKFDMSFILRNKIEHEDIPREFFKQPKDLITLFLLKKAELLAEVYEADLPGKYKPEQFRMKPISTGKMLYVIFMLPAPEFPLNCSFIALGADQEGKNPVYYTIEKNGAGGFYLCVKHDPDTHVILESVCGNTPRENLKALYDHILDKQ